MKVRIYGCDGQGEREKLGVVMLKGRKLFQEPESVVLTNLLSEPLIAYEKNKRVRIDVQERPEKFLEHLTKAVRGSYVWAGEVEE